MLKDFTKEHYDIIIQAGQSNSEGYEENHFPFYSNGNKGGQSRKN